MTIIYLFSRVLGALVGVGLGLVILFFASAWAGIPIGIALGVSVGCLFGLVPPEFVRHGIKFSLRWSDTARLKERLRREHGLALLIIEQLVSRGEPVEQFRDYVESLLRSNSFIRRSCGKECRKKWFPRPDPVMERTQKPKKRKISLIILNCAATSVLLGGCFDMFVPAVPANLLDYLGTTKAEMSPHLASLLLGFLQALGGCLLAIAATAFVIVNGPLKRGERWASWTLLMLIGLSEGINATQMWRFGSPYYWPLTFVALTVVGVVILPNQSEGKP